MLHERRSASKISTKAAQSEKSLMAQTISATTKILLQASIVVFSAALACAETGVVVDINLTPAGDFKAKTSEVTGEAIQDGDTVSAENIIVKLGNLKTGIALRDKHAREKYLEVQSFPEAVLIKATGKGGKGQGRVKIRGVEKDIAGTYKIVEHELNADFTLKLSDFGISGIKYLGVGVDDEVTLHVSLPIKNKSK